MHKKIFLFFILIVVSFSSCKSFDSNSSFEFEKEYKSFIKKITSDESLITLQIFYCDGHCPEYSLAIYEDGTVAYFGFKNVKTVGLHHKSINKESVYSLVSYAIDKGYFNLDSYEVKIDTINGKTRLQVISDLPSKITSVRVNDKRKIVDNYSGSPIWLSYFESRIDSVSLIKTWISE